MTPDQQDAKERARLLAKIDDCRFRPERTAHLYLELEQGCEWWRARAREFERELTTIKATLKELSKGTP